jgi:Leucine Rich repeat
MRACTRMLRSACVAMALLGYYSTAVADQAIARYAADLSYKPHIDLGVILPHLLDHDVASVDLTGSMLGDDRFLNLCESLLLGDSSKPSSSSSLLQLKAQMNRLSATGATRLFQLLLTKTAQGNGEINDADNDGAVPGNHLRHLLNLDLGFNPLLVNADDEVSARRPSTSESAQQRFHAALRSLIGSQDGCPTDLGLDCTGMEASTCRAIAKGIVQRYALVSAEDESSENPSTPTNHFPLPISLRLARNPGIGDPGVAALAAALRTITRKRPGTVVLETLDVSDCDIGDTGAETLAMAFDTTAGRNAIRQLVIGHNRIGNRGLSALCRAFPPSVLVLDGNELITDSGMGAVADMICGERKAAASRTTLPSVSKLSLRSCSLKASGAERIGVALRRTMSWDLRREICLDIDLSGNPLGMLRGKSKGDSKYSASRIKSTISATASAYMNQGMTLLKKGFGSTIESDDEEEKKDGVDSDDEDEDVDQDRCGLKALANAFIFGEGSDDVDDGQQQQEVEGTPPRTLNLGLRRTFCDTAGAEALAAMLVTAKERFHCNIKLDLRLNPVLEEEIVDALHGENDELLHDMSDRHLEAMEHLRQAKQRAALAARATAARLRRDDDIEAEWGSVGSIDDGDSYYNEDPYEENLM